MIEKEKNNKPKELKKKIKIEDKNNKESKELSNNNKKEFKQKIK
jgi:hypothetical protein